MRVRKKRKFYSTILATLLIIIIILTTSLTMALYTYFRRVMLGTINNMNKSVVSQISYGKEYMDWVANNLGIMFLSNNYVVSAMTSNEYNPITTTNALNAIATTLLANKSIDSIYYYNAKQDSYTSSLTGEVTSSASFYDKEVVHILETFDLTTIGKAYPRIITYSYGAITKEHKVYSYIYTFKNGGDGERQSAVIINIQVEFLADMLQAISAQGAYDQEKILCINKDGIIVNSSNADHYLKDCSNDSYIKKILESKEERGTIIDTLSDGENYVFTYKRLEGSDWTLISMVPYNKAFIKLKESTIYFAAICFIILILAFVIAFYSAKKLYQPIGKLNEYIISKANRNETKSNNELDNLSKAFEQAYDSVANLEKQKRANSYRLRSEFVRRVLTGEVNLTDSEVIAGFEKYKMQVFKNKNTYKLLILLKIDTYDKMLERFSSDERDIYEFAIINIVNEIFGESYYNVGTTLGNGEFCFGLQIPKQKLEWYIFDLTGSAEKIQELVRKYLQLDLSIVIGEAKLVTDTMCGAYEQIKQLSNYTFIKGHACIINAEYLKEVDNEYYLVETKFEKKLFDSLKLGQLEEAVVCYQSISDEVVKHSYENMKNIYFYLAYLLYSECCTVVDKETYNFTMIFAPFIGELGRIQSKEEMDLFFSNLFGQIVLCFQELNSKKGSTTIELIQSMVQELYPDKTLCLNEIAERLDKSPAYIGRVFKEKTNKSVAEYILDVRMKEIKRLLDETELSINEIIDQVGMEKTNYFYTLFRKYFGVTLSTYQQTKRTSK